MKTAVSAILGIVHTVSSFLAQESQALGTGYVETLLTSSHITGHAGPEGFVVVFLSILTNVADLVEAL
jgi:hypothetical protein